MSTMVIGMVDRAAYSPRSAAGIVSLLLGRYTAAMTLLAAAVDVSVMALWLGHATPRAPTPTHHPGLAHIACTDP